MSFLVEKGVGEMRGGLDFFGVASPARVVRSLKAIPGVAGVAQKAISVANRLAKTRGRNAAIAQRVASKLKAAGTNLKKAAVEVEKATAKAAAKPTPQAAAEKLRALPSAKVHHVIAHAAAARPRLQTRAVPTSQALQAAVPRPRATAATARSVPVRTSAAIPARRRVVVGERELGLGGLEDARALGTLLAAYATALEMFTQACGMLAALFSAIEVMPESPQTVEGQNIIVQVASAAYAFPEDFGSDRSQRSSPAAMTAAAQQAVRGVPELIVQGNAWLQQNANKTVVSTVQNADGSLTTTYSDGSTTTVSPEGEISSSAPGAPAAVSPGMQPESIQTETAPAETAPVPGASSAPGEPAAPSESAPGAGAGISPDAPAPDEGAAQPDGGAMPQEESYADEGYADNYGGYSGEAYAEEDYGYAEEGYVEDYSYVDEAMEGAESAVEMLMESSGFEPLDEEMPEEETGEDEEQFEEDEGALDLMGAEDVLGLYDLGAARKQMDSLKQVPVGVAQIFVRRGLDAINKAISNADQPWYRFDLPGETKRKEAQAHVQWHVDNLAKYIDPTAVYPDGVDLKEWVLRSFIEQNATEAGQEAAGQVASKAWGDYAAMWIEAGSFLASLPPKALGTIKSGAEAVFQAVRDIPGSVIKTVTGLPLWAWFLIAGGVVVVIGGVAYLIINSKAGATVVGIAAKRYIP